MYNTMQTRTHTFTMEYEQTWVKVHMELQKQLASFKNKRRNFRKLN